jgi:GNAT superfamily N-acetyltransferase
MNSANSIPFKEKLGVEFKTSFSKSLGDGVRVRLSEAADAGPITALINTAFRKAESFLVDRDRIDLASVQQFLATGKFLVAEDEWAQNFAPRPILGCVYLERRGENGERAYLGLLSVDPDRQREGMGAKLMAAAEEYCAQAGCQFMDLQIINVREELPRFYRRLGYVENGTAPLPPHIQPKQPCHFVKMSKPLIADSKI